MSYVSYMSYMSYVSYATHMAHSLAATGPQSAALQCYNRAC
jgi:hypothetical protein